MSNIHGLDFLRREHTLDDDGAPKPAGMLGSSDLARPSIERSASWDATDFERLAASVANKPDLEKQFDVIHFLQAHRSSGFLAPNVIYQRTGIDLQEEEAVAEMLQHNPKIKVELVPDPENPSIMIATYAYQAKYNNVRDRASLLAQVNRCNNGVPKRDLEDAYDGVEEDIDSLICGGDVLAIHNSEDKTIILFPRGDLFLVELDGTINFPTDLSICGQTAATNGSNGTANGRATPVVSNGGPKTSPLKSSSTANADKVADIDIYCMETDLDPQTQIRRGEAVQVGGQWFRISSAVREGSLKDQPARAQAPLSVVSLVDLPKRNEQDGYIRPFSERNIPLDRNLTTTAKQNIQKARQARERLTKLAHGRSGGVATQLLGNHAHASNPTTLAQSFGTNSVTGSRKRPHKNAGRDTLKNQESQKDIAALTKEAALNPFLSLYSHARRHGCTMDVRNMYLGTRSCVPESEAQLKNLLLEHKLLEPGEEMRRPRLKRKANVDNDGKPKKRRYYERKNQRMTNTHLEGTEIGAELRRAQEKQKQGESVGDGGM
eukprot:Nitzschia sp. Nitz4//scaffold7_size249615//169618//171261//NITZ4_001192-RA/size249615-processed-gene-0.203-mRNA-1//-1//CDS//3329558487//5896//frame0